MKITDAELVREALGGSHDAYRELVVRHQQLVFAIILKIVGNYQDAEDLAQETFVKAYRVLHGFRSEAKFSTWLTRIATNKALDHRRKLHRLTVAGINEGTINAAENLHENLPEKAVIHRETMEQARRELKKLPEDYRRVIYQNYVDELSCREIADREGVPIKTIASRLYRGKKILRDRRKKGDDI